MWLSIAELCYRVSPNHKYNTFRSVLLFHDPWVIWREKSISHMKNELDPGILMFYRYLISHKYIILIRDYYQQIKALIFNRSKHFNQMLAVLLLFSTHSSLWSIYWCYSRIHSFTELLFIYHMPGTVLLRPQGWETQSVIREGMVLGGGCGCFLHLCASLGLPSFWGTLEHVP